MLSASAAERRRLQLSIDICCRCGRSAANSPAAVAAVDRWNTQMDSLADGRTDGRTDGRPLHEPCYALREQGGISGGVTSHQQPRHKGTGERCAQQTDTCTDHATLRRLQQQPAFNATHAQRPNDSTFGREVVHVADPERSAAMNDLLADDGEAVDVAFLAAFRRSTRQPQQLRRSPQLRYSHQPAPQHAHPPSRLTGRAA